MTTKILKSSSREKIKEFTDEKDFNKLVSLVKSQNDCTSFLEDFNNYQSDELINVISTTNIGLMKYVAKGIHTGKNSWSEDKFINWMEENSIDILSFADSVRKMYSSYKFSPRIENSFFEILIKEHILDKEIHLKENLNISPGGLESIPQYMTSFPISYMEKFSLMDNELFSQLLEKPVKSYSGKNLIQFVYFNKSQEKELKEAENLFKKFHNSILKPIGKNLYGYIMESSICEHFIREGNQLQSWNFFAPMTCSYELLSEREKEAFIAVGVSQLFNSNSSNKPLSSTVYTIQDIMNSLTVVPLDRLSYYLDVNKSDIDKNTKQEVLSLWMRNNLEKELAPATKTKGFKI